MYVVRYRDSRTPLLFQTWQNTKAAALGNFLEAAAFVLIGCYQSAYGLAMALWWKGQWNRPFAVVFWPLGLWNVFLSAAYC